ncbi:hypothetical protein [Chlamydia felis Fe/C-56]|uniref:Uncharacterized protein n=1 Tax=Chlamydia felis (strain Fe/C-56) TaxID=264202 RepID=Q254P5_CHLFF|nr:hypothetical protein [Chlamydia felis]BAE81243.1 hypothetical protein [Chlamydia felis Fe/C-56]
MTCYLNFGQQDLSDYSTSKKVVCVVFDLITFPAVSVIASILAWSILIIKIVAKTLKFLIQRGESGISLSESFGRIPTEIITEHLILIPLIGSILHGLALVFKGHLNNYASFGSIDSVVNFASGTPAYLEHVINW